MGGVQRGLSDRWFDRYGVSRRRGTIDPSRLEKNQADADSARSLYNLVSIRRDDPPVQHELNTLFPAIEYGQRPHVQMDSGKQIRSEQLANHQIHRTTNERRIPK